MEKDNRWAMLCRLMVKPTSDPGWRWERKLDGDRLRVDIDEHNGIALTARSGADKTAQFPDVVQAIALTAKWDAAPMILDGEIVSANGLSFQEFNQRRMNRTVDIDRLALELPASYVAFDVLSAWGKDMEGAVLAARLEVLDQVRPAWCKAPESSKDGVALFERANREGWEGVVGKRLDEVYLPHRRNWVKVKRWLEDVFDVVGYTAGTGKREKLFGALVVRSLDGKLNAEVGTGFDDAELARLLKSMVPLGPVDDRCKYTPVQGFRVKLKFVEVTNAGSLRFPVYLGKE